MASSGSASIEHSITADTQTQWVHLKLAVCDLLHGNEGHEGAARRVWHVHRTNIWEVAPQGIQDFAFAGDAGNQDVIPRHTRGDALEHGVKAHANPTYHEHVLCAAVGGIAGKLAERALRLVHIWKYFAFDDDLGADGHFEIGYSAAGKPVGLSEQAADDLVFSHVRRIGVDHRAHIVQRVGPQRPAQSVIFLAMAQY